MRPEDIIEDYCKDCEVKRTDEWGLSCNGYCGLHSAYRNQIVGAKKMQEALKEVKE